MTAQHPLPADAHPAPRPTGWRLWFDFGPEAGIHSWLIADLMALTIASWLTILYVWVDQPGASDVGKHSLAGWLVGILGPSWARLGGVAIFAVLSLALSWLWFVYVRWASAPSRARRARRKARRAAAKA